MTGTYHKIAEFQNVHSVSVRRACKSSPKQTLGRRVPPERQPQLPLPGFSEKYFSNLPVSRSNCSASAGGVPLTVMFGQTLA